MKQIILSLFVCIVAVTSAASVIIWNKNQKLQSQIESLQENISIKESWFHSELSRLKDMRELPNHSDSPGKCPEIPKAQIAPCENPRENPHLEFVAGFQDSQINEAVFQKYEMVLRVLDVSEQQEKKVLALLAQRERVLNIVSHGYFANPLDSELALEKREEKLASIDDQVHTLLLDAESIDHYELLKDSGFEQFQLQEVDNALPVGHFLNEQQSKALLLSKLQLKQDYQRAIKEADNMIKSGKKSEGFTAFDDAVNTFKSKFLSAAQGELSEEQFKQLKQYEEESFGEMLISLKAPYDNPPSD